MNNQLILVGHVGQKPETKAFASGSKVTKFSVAVKEFSNKDESDKPLWIDVEAWNGVGDRVVASVIEGREILVSGRLAVNVYDAVAKDGTPMKMSKPVLKLGSFHLAGPKPGPRKKSA